MEVNLAVCCLHQARHAESQVQVFENNSHVLMSELTALALQTEPSDPTVKFLVETHADSSEYFREVFPSESCPPKLHMLEEHTVPFMRKWKVGLGFMGEQGGEGVHARLNNIRCDIRGLSDDLAILKAVIKSHWIQTSPLCWNPTVEE